VTIAASQRPASASEVILGIYTHLEVHVAVTLDGLGRRLGELNVPTTVKGYHKLLHWASSTGRRASVPCGVPVWKVRAATELVWLVT
jgi:hypothetical protein